jgi:hypothetical protein
MKRSIFLILTALLVFVFINIQAQSQSVSRIKVGKSPGSIETADFNNDHFPDLAVTSEIDSSVTILLGKGNGTFGETLTFAAGPIPNDIAIADLNKDGNVDLAFANHEKKYITILFGNGKGTLSSSSNSPFPVNVLPHTHGLAFGDFNTDNRLDLVVDSWANDQVAVFLGDAGSLFKKEGLFLKTGKRPYQRHRVADINGDQRDDIITTNTEGNNCTILISDGKGNFKQPAGSPFACGDAPFGVAVGDLNANGSPDLAIINSPGSMGEGKGKNGLTILTGDGTGNFSMMKGSPFEAGKIPNRIAIGDINGDKVQDIAVSDNDSNKIHIYLMSKNTSVSSHYTITVGNHPKGIAITDFNKDGKGDIAVCNQLDNDISIIISQ